MRNDAPPPGFWQRHRTSILIASVVLFLPPLAALFQLTADTDFCGSWCPRMFLAWRRGGAWDEARAEPEVLRLAADSRDTSPVGVVRELVRSVGALRDIGFENALRFCHLLLRPGGRVAVTGTAWRCGLSSTVSNTGHSTLPDAGTASRPCSTGGKQCLAVNEIVLKGVARTDNGMLAMVENSARKAYILRENDPVFNGYVVKITMDSVVLRENVMDRLGHQSTRDVTKRVTPLPVG